MGPANTGHGFATWTESSLTSMQMSRKDSCGTVKSSSSLATSWNADVNNRNTDHGASIGGGPNQSSRVGGTCDFIVIQGGISGLSCNPLSSYADGREQGLRLKKQELQVFGQRSSCQKAARAFTPQHIPPAVVHQVAGYDERGARERTAQKQQHKKHLQSTPAAKGGKTEATTLIVPGAQRYTKRRVGRPPFQSPENSLRKAKSEAVRRLRPTAPARPRRQDYCRKLLSSVTESAKKEAKRKGGRLNLGGEVAVLHHPRKPRRQEGVYNRDVDLAGIGLDQLQHAAELRQSSLPKPKPSHAENDKTEGDT